MCYTYNANYTPGPHSPCPCPLHEASVRQKHGILASSRNMSFLGSGTRRRGRLVDSKVPPQSAIAAASTLWLKGSSQWTKAKEIKPTSGPGWVHPNNWLRSLQCVAKHMIYVNYTSDWGKKMRPESFSDQCPGTEPRLVPMTTKKTIIHLPPAVVPAICLTGVMTPTPSL